MITPSESASNTSRRILDIMKETWKKKSRIGPGTRWSPVYEHYENVDLVGEVYSRPKKYHMAILMYSLP
jgi:hypothetical protein